MTKLTDDQHEDLEIFCQIMIDWMADNPKEATVNIVEGQEGVLIELNPAPEDVARFIGRQGRMVRAIRTILWTFSAKSDIRIRLKIMEASEEAAA